MLSSGGMVGKNKGYGSRAAMNNLQGMKIHESILNNNHSAFAEGPMTATETAGHETFDDVSVPATGLPLQQLQRPFFATGGELKDGPFNPDGVSDSLGASLTKYSKNIEGTTDLGASSNNPTTMGALRDFSNTRGKRIRAVDHSTDFAGRRGDMGYDTDAPISPAGFDRDIFKFGGS